MSDTAPLLQELLLLPRLHLRAQALAEGLLQGQHSSPYKGFNVEFAEHRPYLPGDELRFVDWKVFAKTDRLFIKYFEEETNLHAHLWLDASRSMAFGSGGLTKWEMASLLASAFAYLLLRQNDRVGLGVVGERTAALPEQSHMAHFRTLCDFMEQQNPADNPMPLAEALHSLSVTLKRRGLVMIFSDFYTEPESLSLLMRNLAARQMDVVLFHLLDPVEIGLDLQGQWRFEDMENHDRLALAPAQLKKAYQRELAEHTGALARLCQHRGASYHLVDISQPPMGVCLEVLTRHGRALR